MTPLDRPGRRQASLSRGQGRGRGSRARMSRGCLRQGLIGKLRALQGGRQPRRPECQWSSAERVPGLGGPEIGPVDVPVTPATGTDATAGLGAAAKPTSTLRARACSAFPPSQEAPEASTPGSCPSTTSTLGGWPPPSRKLPLPPVEPMLPTAWSRLVRCRTKTPWMPTSPSFPAGSGSERELLTSAQRFSRGSLRQATGQVKQWLARAPGQERKGRRRLVKAMSGGMEIEEGAVVGGVPGCGRWRRATDRRWRREPARPGTLETWKSIKGSRTASPVWGAVRTSDASLGSSCSFFLSHRASRCTPATPALRPLTAPYCCLHWLQLICVCSESSLGCAVVDADELSFLGSALQLLRRTTGGRGRRARS